MTKFRIHLIFTIIFLFLSPVYAQLRFSADCGDAIRFEYYFDKNVLVLKTPTPLYKIAIPPQILEALQTNNPQLLGEDFFESEDDFFRYRFEFLKPDLSENLSFVITITHKTEFELKGFSNSLKSLFGGQTTAPVERREFFVTLRSTGRPSQMVFRKYNPSDDFSELEQKIELWCDILQSAEK